MAEAVVDKYLQQWACESECGKDIPNESFELNIGSDFCARSLVDGSCYMKEIENGNDRKEDISFRKVEPRTDTIIAISERM